jgi:hypothetical protein
MAHIVVSEQILGEPGNWRACVQIHSSGQIDSEEVLTERVDRGNGFDDKEIWLCQGYHGQN